MFGWQHSPRKGMRGRPQHVWSQETSNKIKLLLALGWGNERIANAIGVTPPTLRRHYFSELKIRAVARDAMDARRAERLWDAAEKGNVGAMKAFDAFLAKSDLMKVGKTLRGDDGETDTDKEPLPKLAKAASLGKKEAIQQVAQEFVLQDPDLPKRTQTMN